MKKKVKEKYLLIDTNIYIQCCVLELVDGDDIDVLKKLHDLLNKNKVKLLLPEIVQLELYKVLDNKMKDIKEVIAKYKKEINTDNKLDEKMKKELTDNLSSLIEKREKASREVIGELETIFSHKNTIREDLELTSDIFVDAFKYSFHQKKPYKTGEAGSPQNDCLIIETIKKYLSNKKDYVLYLCSNNTSDFAEKEIEPVKKVHKISNDIKEYFEEIKYYPSLLKLLKNVFKVKISPADINEYNEQLGVLFEEQFLTKIKNNLFSIEGYIQCNKCNKLYSKYGLGAEVDGWLLPDGYSKCPYCGNIN